MASSFSEPLGRSGQQAAAVQKKVYMVGGETVKDELSSYVHIFDQVTETWTTKATKGEYIPKLYRGACTSSDHVVYVYGGEHKYSPVDAFYKLDTNTLEWSKHDTVGVRTGAGLIDNNGSIFLFGGRGISKLSSALYCFKDNKWGVVSVTGAEPSPREDFSFTMIDKYRAVLFGGFDGSKNLNDVCILDLNEMHWRVLEKRDGDPWPQGRCAHAAVCLGYDESNPQLLVTGGYTDSNSSTLWMLDINSGRWKELNDFEFQRRYHSATAINMSSEMTEVTLYGGYFGKYHADTVVLLFVNKVDDADHRKWVLLTDTTDSKGREKRIQAKTFAPPYKFLTNLATTSAGESVSVKFFFDQPPNQHVLKKEGSATITAQYEILENEIVFPRVAVEDSGIYTMSYISPVGVEVSSTFVLNVFPAKDLTSDPSYEHEKVKIDKGLEDFGFKFGESNQGLIVTKILDVSQCPEISEGDLIWKVIGKDVLKFSMQELTSFLEKETSVSFEVIRPSQSLMSLEKAIRRGNTQDVIVYLKISNIDVNSCCFESFHGNMSALMIACEEGRIEVVRLLVDKEKVEVNQTNKEGWSALMNASLKGHCGEAGFLLEKGAEVDFQNHEGWSALMVACKGGYLSVAQLLLEKGATVDLQDNKKWSALMVACEKGHLSLARLLLDKKAGKNLRNITGGSALKIASQHGNFEIVKELLKRGAYIDLQDKKGLTALMSACKGDHTEVAELLVQNNANANLQDEKGYTALMISCEEGSEAANMLMEHGVDVEKLSQNGDSALTLVLINRHKSILEKIMKRVIEEESGENANQVDMIVDDKSPFSSDAIPLTLNSLNLIKWKDDQGKTHHFHLVTGAGKIWRKIGVLLNYEMNELDDIKRSHEGSDELCWCAIMEAWLFDEGTDSYPASWNGLYRLLVAAGAHDTAKLLRVAVTHAVLPPPPPTTNDETSSEQQNDKPAYGNDIQQLFYRDHRPCKPPKRGTKEYAMLQDFCGRVQILMQVVSKSEFQAAVAYMKPPENISFKTSVTFPSAGIVVGMFADKKTALVFADEGSKCSDSLEEAMSIFPKAKFLITTGVGYAFDSENFKLGDVLVSQQICDFQNLRFNKKGKLIDRGQKINVTQDLVSVFCKDMSHKEKYKVSSTGRCSKVTAGQIASLPFIVESKEIRDKIRAAVPEAIGGDMESRELLKLRLRKKVEGVAMIKGVVHYADGHRMDEWEFTASLAAVDYVCSKLYNYRDSVANTTSTLPNSSTAGLGSKEGFNLTRRCGRFPPTFIPHEKSIADVEFNLMKVFEEFNIPVADADIQRPITLIEKILDALDTIVSTDLQDISKTRSNLTFIWKVITTIINYQSILFSYTTSGTENQKAISEECKVVAEKSSIFHEVMRQTSIDCEKLNEATIHLKSAIQSLEQKLI